MHIGKVVAKEIESTKFKELQVKVFEMPLTLIGEKDTNKIIYQYITYITHQDGLGLNRVLFFKNSNNYELEGIVGIGPLDVLEASKNKKAFAAMRPRFDVCLAKYDEEDGFPQYNLQMEIVEVKISRECNNCELVASINSNEIIVLDTNNISQHNKMQLEKFELCQEILVCPIYSAGNLYGIFIIDNIYSPTEKFNLNTKYAIQCIIKQLEINIDVSKIANDKNATVKFPAIVKRAISFGADINKPNVNS